MTPINHIRSLGELSAERQVLTDPNIWRVMIKMLHWQLWNSPFFPGSAFRGIWILLYIKRGKNNWVFTSEELNDIGNSWCFFCCEQIAWVAFKLMYQAKDLMLRHDMCKCKCISSLKSISLILLLYEFVLTLAYLESKYLLTYRLIKKLRESTLCRSMVIGFNIGLLNLEKHWILQHSFWVSIPIKMSVWIGSNINGLNVT